MTYSFTAGVFLSLLSGYKSGKVSDVAILEKLNGVTSRGSDEISKPFYESEKGTAELRVLVNNFKSCRNEGDFLRIFDRERVGKLHNALLTVSKRRMRLGKMHKLIARCLDLSDGKDAEIIREIKAFIDLDDSIGSDEKFYVLQEHDRVTKEEFLSADTLCPEAVLLGIWAFLTERGRNVDGQATYDAFWTASETKRGKRYKANKFNDLVGKYPLPAIEPFSKDYGDDITQAAAVSFLAELETLTGNFDDASEIAFYGRREEQLFSFVEKYDKKHIKSLPSKPVRKLAQNTVELLEKIYRNECVISHLSALNVPKKKALLNPYRATLEKQKKRFCVIIKQIKTMSESVSDTD